MKVYVGSWKNTTTGKVQHMIVSSKLPCSIKDLVIGCAMILFGGFTIVNGSFRHGAMTGSNSVSDALENLVKDESDEKQEDGVID